MRFSARKSATHNDLRFLASATPLRFVRNDRCGSMPRNAAFQNKQSISSAFLHWQIFSDNGERWQRRIEVKGGRVSEEIMKTAVLCSDRGAGCDKFLFLCINEKIQSFQCPCSQKLHVAFFSKNNFIDRKIFVITEDHKSDFTRYQSSVSHFKWNILFLYGNTDVIQSRFKNPGILTASINEQFFNESRIISAGVVFDFAIHVKGSHKMQKKTQGQQCQSKKTHRRTT